MKQWVIGTDGRLRGTGRPLRSRDATHLQENDRDGVRRCGQMLHHLSIAALDVSIDSGASTDWGTLCYPPTQ